MKKSNVLAVLLCTVFFSNLAQAVDLAGEWSVIAGKSQGAISGKSEHAPKAPGGNRYITQSSIPWVLKIDGQQGNSFHGQWCSTAKCEETTGVIRKDGTILMVDEDSSYFGTMYGQEMELCVTQPGTSLRLAICHMLLKK